MNTSVLRVCIALNQVPRKVYWAMLALLLVIPGMLGWSISWQSMVKKASQAEHETKVTVQKIKDIENHLLALVPQPDELLDKVEPFHNPSSRENNLRPSRHSLIKHIKPTETLMAELNELAEKGASLKVRKATTSLTALTDYREKRLEWLYVELESVGDYGSTQKFYDLLSSDSNHWQIRDFNLQPAKHEGVKGLFKVKAIAGDLPKDLSLLRGHK